MGVQPTEGDTVYHAGKGMVEKCGAGLVARKPRDYVCSTERRETNMRDRQTHTHRHERQIAMRDRNKDTQRLKV